MSNKYPYKDQHPICIIVCARELTQHCYEQRRAGCKEVLIYIFKFKRSQRSGLASVPTYAGNYVRGECTGTPGWSPKSRTLVGQRLKGAKATVPLVSETTP